jgi:hypothetical protein
MFNHNNEVSMRKKKVVKIENPVVQDVVDKFDTIYTMTKSFVQNKQSALRGLLISGDAGTGKTHAVQRAFIDTKTTHRARIIKAGSITAAALYVELYLNRHKGNVMVLDDCDIIHKAPSEKNTILDMLKGATELTKGARTISWARASANQLMREHEVPNTFDFQGTIIWITNDKIDTIAKKAAAHWNAISSRFTEITVYLTPQEKLLYTLHLIENGQMLGKNCMAKDEGYPLQVQANAVKYIRDNYKTLKEITPRIAIKIADIMDNHPKTWKTLLNNQR